MTTKKWLLSLGFKNVKGNYYERTSTIDPVSMSDFSKGSRYTTFKFRLVRRWLFWYQLTDIQTYNYHTHIERRYENCNLNKANFINFMQERVLPIQETQHTAAHSLMSLAEEIFHLSKCKTNE